LSSSVQNSEGGTVAMVVLNPAKNFNKVFWGFLVVSPLFNHFLGYFNKSEGDMTPKN
jgi:hypothetical protein